MIVKPLPEGLRQSLAEIDAQVAELSAEIKRLSDEKEETLEALREQRQQASEHKDRLLADLFEKQESLGWLIELTEDGKYAVQRFEMPRQPLYADLYGGANAAYADRARQSAAAYGPLGFPPGVPR